MINTPSLPGLADPVHDSQRIFRRVLGAMASPGRICDIDYSGPAPDTLHPAAAAICLALADFETPIWLDPAAHSDETADFLRFHCGVAIVASPEAAAFAVLAGPPSPLDRFHTGTDEAPDRAATVIVQTGGLASCGPVTLAGPGLPEPAQFQADGLNGVFWRQRAAINSAFPRGIDVIVTAGRRIAALPRTTQATVTDPTG